ncbi:uncharacterized protein LOC128239240 [Mya arenaria]|uniref:uncharacterized protein LOC128239240 n=1 Tax=Mya arenaria TaxID=6604 RepID=UPI0022E5D0AF|nr:uncharacterized protein LOC128239240 [Mya arenaria]XP_052811874.1 uncharacterized protein LOC128239240 [Mya arenaria]
MNRTTRIRITELNPHVICVLCGGYFINATTITECLHSFCRTCITRYLETSKYCPVCDVMVHKTKPLDYIRSDKTLQDLVYKLVPGLYKSEMKRRREYYAKVDPPGVTLPPSEDRGYEFYDRIIYTEDEKISLSLELCSHGVPFKTPNNIRGHSGPDNIKVRDVRYLQCPAAFSVGNLKKFIRMKFDLKQKFEMDIFHTAEPLPDYYSLMDIAYIYTWTRRAPLRLFYTVFERRLPPNVIQKLLYTTANGLRNQTTAPEVEEEKETIETANDDVGKEPEMTKKRKLPDGPDDVIPDIDLDKAKPYKRLKKKRGYKKGSKASSVADDDSVKEAMSESEEQLAKLKLDSISDAETVIPDFDYDENSRAGFDNAMVNEPTEPDESNAEICCSGERVQETVVNVSESNETFGENIIATKNGEITVDTNQDNSKPSSTHTSPGSIHLTLFQPLTIASDESQTDSVKENKSCEKLYEFKPDETQCYKDDEGNEEMPVKRPKGRPKGSKNKVKRISLADTKSNDKTSKTDDSVSTKTDSVSTNNTPKKVSKVQDIKKECDLRTNTKTNGNSEVIVRPEITNGNGTKTEEKVKRKYVRKKNVSDKTSEVEGVGKRAKKDTDAENGTVDGVNVGSVTAPQDKTEESSGRINDESHLTNDASNDDTCESGVDNSDDTSEHEKVQMETNETNKINLKPSLLEPVTPLYGETPNLNESNQGLPCSPTMDSSKTKSDQINCVLNNPNESSGAIVKTLSDNNTNNMNLNGVHFNGAIVNKGQMGFDLRPSLMYPNIQPAFLGFNRGLMNVNMMRPEVSVSHFGFRNDIGAITVPTSMCIMGSFAQSPMNAHAQFNHMLNVANDNGSCDINGDQPLDLTNGVQKEEYTKGKIFKTKMLKKVTT